jgi:SAM-dependent methyltransferase
MNALQRVEYVTLRMARRFLFTEYLANRLARWLPYYASSENERHPDRIVTAYTNALSKVDLALTGKRVLEVGAGRTNAVGYGLVGGGAQSVVLLEPFVSFDPARDDAVRNANPAMAAIDPASVTRAVGFGHVSPSSVQLLLSNSVLEHVSDPNTFFADCLSALSSDGVMLHVVDYRDHFFKYPYAFLTFSKKTWDRWLNPGDLERWRMYDHVEAMRAAGFDVSILHEESNPEEFATVRDQLDSGFLPPRQGLDVMRAVIFARKSGPAPAPDTAL